MEKVPAEKAGGLEASGPSCSVVSGCGTAVRKCWWDKFELEAVYVKELQHRVSLDSGPCASEQVQVGPVLWFRGKGRWTVTLVRARLAVSALSSGHAVAARLRFGAVVSESGSVSCRTGHVLRLHHDSGGGWEALTDTS